MDPTTLDFWANVAAILLMVEAFILSLAVGALMGVGWWYLRKGRKALGLPLLYAQVYALRAQHLTMRVSEGIAEALSSLHAAMAWVQAAARTGIKRKTRKE